MAIYSKTAKKEEERKQFSTTTVDLLRNKKKSVATSKFMAALHQQKMNPHFGAMARVPHYIF